MARIAYKQGMHKRNRALSSNHRKRKSPRKYWGYRKNSIKRLPGQYYDEQTRLHYNYQCRNYKF